MFSTLRRFYEFRELVMNLAKKDFKVRYKSATLGFLWALLNPLLLMAILSIVFSLIMKIQVEKYPVFLLTALIPWTCFSLSVTNSTTAITDNGNLIKKVFFPREIIPAAVNLANLFNFLLSLVVLFVFLLVFRVALTPTVFLLPFVILIQLTFTVGLSLITSCLHVYYRDVKYLMEALLVFWFYATPIFYPLSMVPERIMKIYMLNPMASIVTMYRNILLEGCFPDPAVLACGLGSSLVVLVIGFHVFRKLEPNFADVV
jgi:ABC-2 type transport system permease protein